MASLKDIRKRISSVKNTRQITRAMKMVAAAKLRRAQDAIISARPYAYRIYSILYSLAQEEGQSGHPLLAARPEKRVKLVVLAGDRGLCGSFNANIFKETLSFLRKKENEKVEVTLDCIGRKAFDFFKKKAKTDGYYEGILARPDFGQITQITKKIFSGYEAEEVDAIYLVYNEFKSAIQQKVALERLAPIAMTPPEGVVSLQQKSVKKEKSSFAEKLFEPNKTMLLEHIVPKHFAVQVFRAVLESIASEHGARMSAMENATKNASEMMERLTLEYNKARQASITKELMEIVGGVEAMR